MTLAIAPGPCTFPACLIAVPGGESGMSRSTNDSSWGRRRSLFALTTLRPTTPRGDEGPKPLRSLGKPKHGLAKAQQLLTDLRRPDGTREAEDTPPQSPLKSPRPSTSSSRGVKRAPSMFDRRTDDVDLGEPLSAASTKAPSVGFSDGSVDGLMSAKVVLLHGEVQTSAGMFRKKKEFLVLTDTHILRYKSQARAAELFKVIPHPAVGRSPTIRHESFPSIGSHSDLQTLSDSSGDKDGRMPLRQVVAVVKLDDGKPYFALEIAYLDEESAHAAMMTLQFPTSDERDLWLNTIRTAVIEARLRGNMSMSASNLENIARVMERDHDYDPAHCAMYKMVQRHSASKSANRSSSSSEDMGKVASTVCFLAVGIHKIHIIAVVRDGSRSSSSRSSTSQTSYGILNLISLKVSAFDDTFELTFRQPLQRPAHLYLASAAAHEIAARLHFSENYLRPECGHRLFRLNTPPEVESLLSPVLESNEEHSCLDRTLSAYCIAYGVNPANVRYTISHDCEDAPRFELLPPADTRRPEYGPLDLLAIMRALRYNESFGSISLAGIPLNALNGLHDNYGQEHVCSRTKRGTPIRLTTEELEQSCLLVQEIRALAATSKKLRRMDFSGCFTTKPVGSTGTLEDDMIKNKDIGCGIIEALSPLCKHQTTNVDWICLNGIILSETDLDYLVGAAVERSCHFRAIELNRCGLNDRSMGMVLDALRAQDNTLEAIEIAGNPARLNPASFDGQLGMFGFIRKLNLSYFSRTSGEEPLLQAETLLVWRLQELRLSGTALNSATIDAIATYLAHPQSNTLHELYVDNSYLSGNDVAILLHSLAAGSHGPRALHLDISQSHLSKGLDQFTKALLGGKAPSHLSMRAIEWREETQFRKVIAALTVNKSISYLDMSHTSLPGDASTETCRAFERLLAENQTIVELNLSGEDSRLATSKFGSGINTALVGLKTNTTLVSFRIEGQKLGLQGANTLAEVVKENKTLRELFCDNNEIPLQGLTDLVNALIGNTTLIYLPTMDDGRAAAFRAAERTMKMMADEPLAPASPPSPSFFKQSPTHSASVMKKSLASVRRTATRGTAFYTPSFPALPSYIRSRQPSDHKVPLPVALALPPPRNKQGSTSPATPLVSFTVQDIQTTQRLLTEQWDRQCFRLAQYLERNWCLLNNLPANMEIEDEKFERPSSVGSIGKMLEQVKSDTTPRTEKDAYFDAVVVDNAVASTERHRPGSQPLDPSYQPHLYDNDPSTLDSDDLPGQLTQLRLDSRMVEEDPSTPTQTRFRI